MCGRYTLTATGQELAELFGLPEAPVFDPRYNIAPTQPVPLVRAGPGGRELVLARWGLIPHWAQDPSIGNRLINARAETVAEKASFRDAFRRRRCLVPATGFYEWHNQGGRKQPFHFRLADGRPFAFAGLWERWQGPEGALESCTVLTTAANAVVRPVHERMPVLLDPRDYAQWLDAGPSRPEELLPLLRPFPEGPMVAVPVGRWVNDPRHEGATCLSPAG